MYNVAKQTFIDRIYSFSRESFMADRTGLDGTMLHYLAVQQAMVNVPIYTLENPATPGEWLSKCY